MAKLYSKNSGYPKELPFRIRFGNGMTRTDPTTFTAEEIADAGYIEVSEPPEIPNGKVLLWTGTAWTLEDSTSPD